MGNSASYDKWATADQSCASYAAYVEGLKEKRAEAVRYAWQAPEAATATVARLDAELAGAVSIKRALWIRRMECYRQHQEHLAAGRAGQARARTKRKAAEAVFMGATA